MFSERIQRLGESLTMAMTQKGREVKASGKKVYNFSVGEPDFDTPNVIKEAAKKAIDDGFTKYTPVGGIPDLISAIKAKLERENNLFYSEQSIVVSNGAKQSLFNLLAVLLNHGDEVIIPTPAWVSYPDMVSFFGGTNIFVPTKAQNNFKMTAQELQDAITSKSKILILNSPSNPTGAVYSKEEYEALAGVLKNTNIIVFTDEMYEKLIYDVPFTPFASIDGMFEKSITINGLSKSVAMTGWRMGYFASFDEKIAKAVTKLQGQSTSNINSITQKASIVALNETQNEVNAMRDIFKSRRDLAMDLLGKIDGIKAIKPDGAFYIFASCEEIEPDSMKFCLDLLEQKGVSTVPGLGFKKDGYFRLSFALGEDEIKEGIALIGDFAQKYNG